MGQSLWMCCSQPQPQPVGAGQEPCGRSTQAIGHLLFRSSGHFSRMENPHLESWSPGSAVSEQPMDREEPPKPPLAQGTVTLMPIGGNTSVEPSSRDSPGQSHEEMCNTGGTKICLAPIQPWAPAGTIMARQFPARWALPCLHPSSCHRQQGWAGHSCHFRPGNEGLHWSHLPKSFCQCDLTQVETPARGEPSAALDVGSRVTVLVVDLLTTCELLSATP